MSGVPDIADHLLHPRKSAEVGQLRTRALQQRRAGLNLSVDHLVSNRKDRWGYSKAERLCRLEIDHQLELDWTPILELGPR
jgi:hypothetical protein